VGASFGKRPASTLAARRVKAAGTVLNSVNPVFLYNVAVGALASNGNGAGGISQIGTLTEPKTLLASDTQVTAA
jgi:hypothetical protein